MMKNKLISALMLLLLNCYCISSFAQRHFYHRLDVGSSNIYTFVGSNLITGYANYFTHDILFDNSFTYSIFQGTYQGRDIKTKAYSPIGITAKDLFNDVFAGAKLGYQSDNMGTFNWGIYASAHYKINQIQAKFPSEADYTRERFQYIKPGLGVLLTFGSIESKTKVQLEAAIRYDVPISYDGLFGNNKKTLNDGISSQFAIKVAGYSWFSAGAFVNLNYYDLYDFKNLSDNSKFRMYNIGITFTITPKRGEDIYD